MVLGADTGFFLAYARKMPRALEIWQEIVAGQTKLIASTVTANELLVYFFKRGLPTQGQDLVQYLATAASIELVPVSLEIYQLDDPRLPFVKYQ